MPPQLPGELSDNIIDCLSNDRRTLTQTSLVCRVWLPRSRKYLFEIVTFNNPESWKPFSAAMAALAPTQSLVSCAAYVSHMVVGNIPANPTRSAMDLALLCNVHTITLNGASTAEEWIHCEQLRSQCNKSVHTLILSNFNISRSDRLLVLLKNYPYVRSLCIGDPERNGHGLKPLDVSALCDSMTQDSSAIRELNLSRCSFDVVSRITEILLEPQFTTQLQTLHLPLGAAVVKPSTPINSLCIASASTLENLHLHQVRRTYQQRGKLFA